LNLSLLNFNFLARAFFFDDKLTFSLVYKKDVAYFKGHLTLYLIQIKDLKSPVDLINSVVIPF